MCIRDRDNIELVRAPSARLYNALAELGFLNKSYRLYIVYSDVYIGVVKTPENLILGITVFGGVGKWATVGLQALAEKTGIDVVQLLRSKALRLIDYSFFDFTKPFRLELLKKIADFSFLEKYFGKINYLLFMVNYNKLVSDKSFEEKIEELQKVGFKWLAEKKNTLMWYKVRSNESEASQEA